MQRLAQYREKRNFDVTSEPPVKTARKRARRRAGKLHFVVQLHHASHRHFDFRLEWQGTLRSWAIPKGPSRDPEQKRLAVEVEDHPLDYGHFEGDIPEGQYGAGHVDIWDEGEWLPEGDAAAALKKGHLNFTLRGSRLAGRWSLIRTRLSGRQPQWLLIKSEDDAARAGDVADDLPLRAWKGQGKSARNSAAATRRTGKSTAARSKPAPTRRRRDPFPREIGLQLARLSERAPVGNDWIHEIKYDGYRFVAMRENRRVRVVSRNGGDWSRKLPALRAALLDLPCRDCIIDGELVVHDDAGHSSFDLLQQAFGNDDGAITAVVFDLLYRDGHDLRSEPQDARRAALETLLAAAPAPLRLSDTMIGDGAEAARAACRLGLEGIVCKSRSAPYREGRGGAWLKVKCVQSEEFVIVAYTTGHGARAEMGSLLLAQPGPTKDSWRYVGRVGSGLSERGIADLLKRLKPTRTPIELINPPTRANLRGAKPIWVQPALVGEVNYRAWTRDHILRQASLKGVRPDKSPDDLIAPNRPPLVETQHDAARKPRNTVGASRRKRKLSQSEPYAFTHPERLIFEEPAITKADIGALYTDIASQILPEIIDRPLALMRCPDGVGDSCFFQKHLTPGFRDAVHAAHAKNGRDPYVYIKDLQGLLALVQMNVVEIHPWGAHLADTETPDRVVFDLDPAPDVSWRDVKHAARQVRERLTALKLVSFLRASGGKGLHVVVPLTGRDGWDNVKAFAQALAQSMSEDEPARYIATASKARRNGKIFIDYLRNARGSTSIANYSLRARPGAPMAVPLAWDELARLRSVAQFHFGNIRKRIAAHPQAWRGIEDVEQALPRI